MKNEFELERNEKRKEKKKECVFYSWEYRKHNELLLILWICWGRWILLGIYAIKILDLLKICTSIY